MTISRPIRTFASVAVLALLSLAFLLPFLWMLSASLRTQGDLLANPQTLWPEHITWDNYREVWQRIPFGRQFLNTVVYAGIITVVSVLLDSMAGYAFARFTFPGRGPLFVVVLVTLMLPIQVTLIPVFQLLNDLGWINTYQGLIVPRVADAFGIFFMRQFFLSLPRDLEDAGRIDGFSEFGIWRRIMMPLAWPAVLTLGLFNLLYNWNDLLWPLIVTTDENMRTLSAGLALFKGQHSAEYGLLMAGAILALLPMVAAFALVQRRFIEGIATTGLK
ncbi:carbohydrate ABC transporter permease [Phytohabitans aurantiacus]|uniref:Sugar ABC transporter ATP-binding protein n=1 Tax=Phytohabitans aurantiacus TaxID=3016789 RepID=A0ABQ5R8F9_9ACTN|nr:carbohydrate ABC transporter permease [Phytohabitans aurantiacus]GLI02172.1 sugar ABC transporter ATP-binding protein [Phytohabitans aurantiacus]